MVKKQHHTPSFLGKSRRQLGRLLAGAVLPLLALAPITAGAATSTSLSHFQHCRNVNLPASIDPGGAVSIYGEFCQPLGRPASTIQLLVHGATYNHTYWDFPGFDGQYSYVQAANRARYATLAIDRLGVGQSSHPVSGDVSYQSEVSTIHQIVTAIRSGKLGPHFGQVELIGHSFGSAYSVGEASTYHDVDAVVLTGFGHMVSAAVSAQSRQYVSYPANNLARFSSLNLDSGYVTTQPGSRGVEGLFYHLPLADPAVIAADDASRDTVTTTEFATRPPNLGVLTPNIQVPVLIADGRDDLHYCTADTDNCSTSQTLLASEAPYFNTCLSTLVLNSGHDINLHVTAQQSFRAMLSWSRHTIPPHGSARCAAPGAQPSPGI